MPHSDQMLTSVSIGQRCVLADINTEELNDATRRRLAELGFRPGTTGHVIFGRRSETQSSWQSRQQK